MARVARHSHSSPPEEKAASRKKSRLRRKKTAPTAKKNGASCVSRGHVPTCGDLPQPTLRGSSLSVSLSPSCASGFAFRLLRVAHNTPSPMATCSPSHLSHPTFCSLPPHSSHHPYKPHQIKQSLSKRAVNERAVGKRQSILQKRWLGYLLYCKL